MQREMPLRHVEVMLERRNVFRDVTHPGKLQNGPGPMTLEIQRLLAPMLNCGFLHYGSSILSNHLCFKQSISKDIHSEGFLSLL